jgi:hypothetical protein
MNIYSLSVAGRHVGEICVRFVSERFKMGKVKGVKRKCKDITEAEEEFSDNETPAKVRSSDEPTPKKVNQFNW